MSLACHSVHAKPAVEALNEWRGALTKYLRSSHPESDEVDAETLAANRQSALEAARNMGAAMG